MSESKCCDNTVLVNRQTCLKKKMTNLKLALKLRPVMMQPVTSSCKLGTRSSDQQGSSKWRRYVENHPPAAADATENSEEITSPTNFGSIRLDSMNKRD